MGALSLANEPSNCVASIGLPIAGAIAFPVVEVAIWAGCPIAGATAFPAVEALKFTGGATFPNGVLSIGNCEAISAAVAGTVVPPITGEAAGIAAGGATGADAGAIAVLATGPCAAISAGGAKSLGCAAKEGAGGVAAAIGAGVGETKFVNLST